MLIRGKPKAPFDARSHPRLPVSNLAPEFEQDARVLNRLTGHLDSATRERVYQDPQNERVRARAAETRRRMRQHLGEGRAA
jgi:hypothetical protein